MAHLALTPVSLLAGVGLWLQTRRTRTLRGRVQTLEEALFRAKVLLRERAGDLAQNERDVEEWLAELLPVIRALEGEAAGLAPGHPLLRRLEGLRALHDSMGLSLGRPPRFSALRRQVAGRSGRTPWGGGPATPSRRSPSSTSPSARRRSCGGWRGRGRRTRPRGHTGRPRASRGPTGGGGTGATGCGERANSIQFIHGRELSGAYRVSWKSASGENS